MSHGYPECCRVVDVDNIQEIHEKLSMNVHIAVLESEISNRVLAQIEIDLFARYQLGLLDLFHRLTHLY